MSRSEDMDAVYGCDDPLTHMACTTRDPWDYPPVRRSVVTPHAAVDLPAELLPDIEDNIADTLAAAMRHVLKLMQKGLDTTGIDDMAKGLPDAEVLRLYEDKYREIKHWRSPRQRAGDFVTDIRRGLREFECCDQEAKRVAPDIYNKLIRMLANVDIWQDFGELRDDMTRKPSPAATQIMEWLKMAEHKAELTEVEEIDRQLDNLRWSVPNLDTYTRLVASANQSAEALLGQIEAVLDGQEVPKPQRLGDYSFVKTNLTK